MLVQYEISIVKAAVFILFFPNCVILEFWI